MANEDTKTLVFIDFLSVNKELTFLREDSLFIVGFMRLGRFFVKFTA